MATHVFQPFDHTVLAIDPFSVGVSRPALLVTGKEGERCNAMTIGWGTAGRVWNRNVGIIFVRGSRFTKEIIDKYDTFSVTFFKNTRENSLLLKYFGTASGRTEDKIKSSRLELDYFNGTPYIDEGELVAVMRKLTVTEMKASDFCDKKLLDEFYTKGTDKDDFHWIYTGEILQLMAR